jgi:hypothetical protein
MKIVAESWKDTDQRLGIPQAKMEEWADGQVRELVQGEDFFVSIESLRGSLASWGSRNGYRLRSSTRLLPEGHIRFAFVPRNKEA